MKRFARVSVLSIILLAVVAVALLTLPLRPTNQVYGKPLSEDGFLSLTVARNIAEGNGVTADSQGAPTNGFQPLFTFVTVPVFWIAGEDSAPALRLILLLQILVLLATGLVLGAIVADTFPRSGLAQRTVVVLTALAYSSAIFVIVNGLNGLETGFLLLMYTVVWRVYQVRGLANIRDGALLGGLMGALVLTRIDAMVLVVVCCVYIALGRRNGAIVRAAVVGGTAALVSITFCNLVRSCRRARNENSSGQSAASAWPSLPLHGVRRVFLGYIFLATPHLLTSRALSLDSRSWPPSWAGGCGGTELLERA